LPDNLPIGQQSKSNGKCGKFNAWHPDAGLLTVGRQSQGWRTRFDMCSSVVQADGDWTRSLNRRVPEKIQDLVMRYEYQIFGDDAGRMLEFRKPFAIMNAHSRNSSDRGSKSNAN
jgi:hypothetical protein